MINDFQQSRENNNGEILGSSYSLPPEETDTVLESEKEIILGRYRIICILGKGGMGVVYLAEDMELERLVAVKKIQNNLARNEKYLKRFKIEARSAAQVQHPNIARIFHSGEDQGDYYFIMEYVKGVNLEQFIKNRSFSSLAEFVDIAIQIVSGLKAAHDKNILHRDIKPGNMILDDSGVVKILDFGLARPIEGNGTVTYVGESIGTPRYMAPEQINGDKVDQRTDIYLAGVTLFELITGTTPRKIKSPEEELIEKIGVITSKSQRRASLDRAIARIILKAISVQADDRYQDAGEFVEDLNLVEEEANSDKSTPRKLKVILGVCGVLAATIVLLLVFNTQSSRLEKADGMLDKGRYREAIQVLQEIDRTEPSYARAQYGLGYCYLREGNLEKAEEEFSRIPENSDEETALREEGKLFHAYEAGEYDRVRQLAGEFKGDGGGYSFFHTILGNVFLEKGELESAINEYEEAIQVPAVFPSQKSYAYAGMARSLREKGDLREALKYYHQAVELKPNDPGILAGLGMAYAEEGDYSRAVPVLKKALGKSPDNEIAHYLSEKVLAKKQWQEEESAQRERIDKLIDDLQVQAGRKSEALGSNDDASSISQLPALALLDFKKIGGNFKLDGAYEAYMQALVSALVESGDVSVVQREILEEILSELKLGSSDLASPKARLKLGKIIPARFMVAGSFNWINGEIQATIFIIDTESSLYLPVVKEILTTDNISEDTKKLSKNIIIRIQQYLAG
jgi:serine/threonine protein kinase